jgi:hypothetical protein
MRNRRNRPLGQVGTLVLAAALCASACSSEKGKVEATGLGTALGLAVLSPLIVLTIPYAIAESVVDGHNQKELAERLDPVYQEFTRSIRQRDAAADADAVFRESGATFLIAMNPATPNGLRNVAVPGVLNPDAFVCQHIAPYGDPTSLAVSLRNLVSNDPLSTKGESWSSVSSLDSWKDYDTFRVAYSARFNRRMIEIAAPAGVIALPEGDRSFRSSGCNAETGAAIAEKGPIAN